MPCLSVQELTCLSRHKIHIATTVVLSSLSASLFVFCLSLPLFCHSFCLALFLSVSLSLSVSFSVSLSLPPTYIFLFRPSPFPICPSLIPITLGRSPWQRRSVGVRKSRRTRWGAVAVRHLRGLVAQRHETRSRRREEHCEHRLQGTVGERA